MLFAENLKKNEDFPGKRIRSVAILGYCPFFIKIAETYRNKGPNGPRWVSVVYEGRHRLFFAAFMHPTLYGWGFLFVKKFLNALIKQKLW